MTAEPKRRLAVEKRGSPGALCVITAEIIVRLKEKGFTNSCACFLMRDNYMHWEERLLEPQTCAVWKNKVFLIKPLLLRGKISRNHFDKCLLFNN